MANFLPSLAGLPPEILKQVLEGDYISGKTPGPATKAPKLPGGTYEGTASRVKSKAPVRSSANGSTIGNAMKERAAARRAARLPSPASVPKGVPSPRMGAGGAATLFSLMANAQPTGLKNVPAPFASAQDVGKVQLPTRESLVNQPVVPFRKEAPQTRTPSVPPQIQQEVKSNVEAGKVSGEDYVKAAVQKADLDNMAKKGKGLSTKEKEAIEEKEGSFWNQLGIDGKTAALIGVGLAATAAGYGKGGFEQGVGQGIDVMNQAFSRRDARTAAQAQQAMAQEKLDIEREKLDIMRGRLKAKAEKDAKPESVATKQSLPQISAGVEDVMTSLELTPSSFFGMGGGNLPDEETYLRLKQDFADYVYSARQQGDTRGMQDLVMERYKQLSGN